MNSELFGVHGVKLRAAIHGLPERLPSGLLPTLEEAVNAQEVFDSSSRIAQRFMRLEGENWTLEFDTRQITIWASGFLDCRAVEEGVSFFLGQIKETVACHFWADRVGVMARWPLEPNPRRQKSAGQILYEKSSRLKPAQLDLLPKGGILGAGIALVGISEEGGTWQLDAGPVGDTLVITLEMDFEEPDRPEWPQDELAVIQSNIAHAYSTMDNEVKAFINSVMP